MSQATLLHAMDLASMQEWDASKALLQGMTDPIAGRFFLLVCELERQAQRRERHATTVRHEVGNALTIAQANIEGIADGILPATPERLDGILASISSAGSIIDGFASTTNRDGVGEVIRIETLNICALIAAHAAAIDGLARAKNVAVVYDPCGQQITSCESFRGDPSRIGQMLRNVLLNAVRYTPPGGSVEIRCDNPGSEITLVVTDSGIGIADDDAAHLFEAGFRGSNTNETGGSGIGLNVVEKILQSLGGTAKIRGEQGKGTAFTIVLPTIPLSPHANGKTATVAPE